jgi:DNA repair photolyase
MRHGSQSDPPNRFVSVRLERDDNDLEWDSEYLHTIDNRKVVYQADLAQSIVAQNDSPDLPFRYSVNPYRGCAHGCSYCYARNTHEYLGLNAGLDFETRILVKHDAPRLLRQFLARDAWNSEVIVFSGVTDCYQPAERDFKLTRDCLSVARDSRQAIGIVTKNALVLRDLDLLVEMAQYQTVEVFLSITTLDPKIARDMEPRTSTPQARLRAVETLAAHGVPVGVMVAPLIPGINEHEMPAIMQAAREAGALDARYLLLRLPLTVEPVFREWLTRTNPNKMGKTLSYLQSMRNGRLNSSTFGERHTGTGELASQIANLHRVVHTRLAFPGMPKLDTKRLQRPTLPGQQLRLF